VYIILTDLKLFHISC